MAARSRIWAAVKDNRGNISNKVLDVDHPLPDEYFAEKHPTVRPYYFALWMEGRAPEMTERPERQGSQPYAQWWWDEDERRADGAKHLSFPGKL
jgi:hypothetical protein